MTAATFVGRVAGLALALGAGTVIIVTPIQVRLNGQPQTVSVPMADIAYTVEHGDSLRLQITSSAVNYENLWSYGWIDISDINLNLPLHTPDS